MLIPGAHIIAAIALNITAIYYIARYLDIQEGQFIFTAASLRRTIVIIKATYHRKNKAAMFKKQNLKKKKVIHYH